MRQPTDRFFSHVKYFLPGGLIVVLVSTFIWRFALIGSKTLFQGDEIIFGLPLLVLRTRVVEGVASMLWSPAMYGGHPIFAEGQAAFLSPLPLLVAALVAPVAGAIYAMNLFAFLCMAGSGIGVIGLCRSLKLSPWAAALAAMAVTFSGAWLQLYVNPAWCGTLLWCPWALWALEVWIGQPGARRAVVLGLALGNAILAGYPQLFHGLVIYMAVTLLPNLPTAVGVLRKSPVLRSYFLSGVLAVVVCVGVAAVQLLPLAELVPFSQRKSGIGLEFQVGASFYTRGLLFSFPPDENVNHYTMFSVSSLLVCGLASLAIFAAKNKRILGHFLAGIAVLTLGYGSASPVFRFAYEHHLIPGLHNFRTTYHYLGVGVMGIAVAAAGSADLLSKVRMADFRWKGRTTLIAISLGIFWTWVLVAYATRDVFPIQYILPVVAIMGAIILIRIDRARLLPAALAGLLLVECLALRLNYFRLVDTAALSEPDSARAVQAIPDWRDYKLIDVSDAVLFQFNNEWSDVVRPGLARMMSCMTGLTPILWNMKTMDGALALTFARRTELQQILVDEINGKASNPPGLRLIDILSVRYVCVNDPATAPGFRELWHRPRLAWIMENVAAHPRFQIYERAVTATSPATALALLQGARQPLLVIEDPEHLRLSAADGAIAADNNTPPATFDIKKARDTFYRVDLTAARPCWLFLADANYPGWSATIDGQPALLFTAQILGKAVQIPAGRHQVTIEFHSSSFMLGAGISGASLLLILAVFLRPPRFAAP